MIRAPLLVNARRLPPYAHEILSARQAGDFRGTWGASADGCTPTITLCVGHDAWYAARDWAGRRLITLLPPGEDPEQFDWRCIAGADPLLLWRCGPVDGEVLVALLKAIMRDGTDRVLDLATGKRYVARVEEVRDERAA